MRKSIVASLIGAACVSGCISLSVPGGFSPIQGPLAHQSPLPGYTAKMSGLLSGTISVDLNGETCSGPWAFVGKAPPPPAGSEAAAAAAGMPAVWDLVYGPGFYVAHVVGDKLYARATLTGGSGTVVFVELSNETNTRGNTKGVARDNHGNVFKVSVYN